ncbi:MAG TPA: flavodoxin family protein [Clostridiales bacterium]|nr:flavodoxin family protein [Clostridiales bacterium]
MKKKILVLTGSPRKGGNSDMLADAFIAGAKSAGHEAYKFETAFMDLHGCNACNTCWSTDTACSQKDDFNKLEPLVESCDAVVFAAPLYWFAFPAQLKNVIDRFYAYGGTGGPRPMTIKESVLLFCSHGTDEQGYAPIVKIYEMSANYLGWKNRGVLTVNGVGKPGEIQKTDALEKAGQMGRDL